MKKMIWLAMSLLVSTAMAGDMIEKAFDVDPGARFSLDSHKGNIEIRTEASSQITVRYRIYMGDDAKGLSAAEEADIIDAVEVNIISHSGSVDVDVDYERANDLFKSLMRRNHTMPMVDFQITLPDDAELSLESHKSGFDVDAPSGRVVIESHKGQGAIRGVRNDFSMETHKGKFKVEILEVHNVEIETHKGDVTLTLHGANNFTLRGESHKGDFEISGSEARAKRDEDGEITLYHRVGSGANRIDLETHKGTIALDFVN